MKISANSTLLKTKGSDRRTIATTFRMSPESERKVRFLMRVTKKKKTVVLEEMIDAAYEAERRLHAEK